MRSATKLATVLLCAALAVTACSDDGDDNGADGDNGTAGPTVTATSQTATTSATASPTTTGSATESPSGTATATGSASETTGATGRPDDRCRKSDVDVNLRELDSAPGQRYADIVLTNTSSASCTIEGFNDLQLLDADRDDLPTRVINLDTPAPEKYELAPGDTAAAQISFSVVASPDDRSSGPCQPRASFLAVTPPGQANSTRVAWELGPVCDRGRIEQTAYVTFG